MRKIKRSAFTLALCLSRLALADFTLVSESAFQGHKRTLTLSTLGTKAYFEMKDADGSSDRVILRDAELKKMFIIDHAKKIIITVSDEESKALEAKQAAWRERMKAQLAKMPPERRAQIEAAMPLGDAKTAPFTFEKKKGKPRKVNGFACEDYTIKREGKLYGEGCFAAWKAVGVTATELKANLERALPQGSAAVPGSAMEEWVDVPGFPVWRTHVGEAGAVVSETTVTSIVKTAVAAERFQVPQGYTEKTMGEFRGPTPAAPSSQTATPPSPAK
jgi:Domain of unknown function (DUF4412)